MKYSEKLVNLKTKLMKNYDLKKAEEFKKIEEKFIKCLSIYTKENINNKGLYRDGSLILQFDNVYDYEIYDLFTKILYAGKLHHFEEEYKMFLTNITKYELDMAPSYTLVWNYKEYFDGLDKEKVKGK